MKDREREDGIGTRRPNESEVENFLQELKPAELPPFYRTRLLARLREERRGISWVEAVRAPAVAWTIAAVSVVALVLVVSLSQRGGVTPRALVGLEAGPAGEVASDAVIDPVTPVGNSVVGAGDVEIVAAIDPPLAGGLVRLYVDDVDVTGLAEVTESYVVYSPGERFTEGEHIITIEIRDRAGARVTDVSWLFYALNGDHAPADERV